MTRRLANLLVAAALLLAAAPALGSARTSTGPSVSVPTAALRSAMNCKGRLQGAHRDPVLLVPGTFGWGAINWGWNYQQALPERGWPACTVDLPAHGAGDVQLASQYVVYAIRTMAHKSGRRVAVIGHSQGGLEARWALKWWPDLRGDVSDVITLAAPNHGALFTNLNCGTPDSCATSLYQMRSDSAFLRALNAGSGTFPGISYTAIATTTDKVFVLPPEASLAGAQNIRVQDLCPSHQVDHVSLAFDGPTFGIVMDALSHSGPAKLSRISHAWCATDTMPGVTRTKANTELAVYSKILAQALGPNGPRAVGEPPLACYVTGRCRRNG